jgi:hypothetical protein
MAQLNVEITTYGRCIDWQSNEIRIGLPDTAVVSCPMGDAYEIVVCLDISGDVMSSIPKEAITILQPKAGHVEFFDTEIADSTPVFVDGVYRTTITVEEYSGCGRDSAMVNIFGVGRGYAHINVKSPDLPTDGVVDLIDLSRFLAAYTSSPCNCIPGNNGVYDICADYAPPQDTTIDIIDFSVFAEHYLHYYDPESGSQSPRTVAYSEGTVELNFDEDYPLQGERLLKASVILKNVEPYSVVFLALKNENPIFKFRSWHQDEEFLRLTMCIEFVRNGQREIVLGLTGSKYTGGRAIALGYFELAVSSDEPLTLTEDDFALVTADLLELAGGTRIFKSSQVHRNMKPTVFRNNLAQNFPNPFNPSTTIAYSIADDTNVDLRIYDVTGALVKTLVDDFRKKNNYKIVWDGINNQGNSVASGVYFYRLIAGDFRATKKMVLLR